MSFWLYGSSIGIGWLVGGAANWLADFLPSWGIEPDASLPLSALPNYWWPWQQMKNDGRRRPLLLHGAMIAIFVIMALLLPVGIQLLAIMWLYVAFLLTVLVIDLEHRRVLNIMLGPAALVVLALSLLPETPTPLNALLGGSVGLGLFFLLAVIRRGALGFGDVKLAGVIGLMTGYPQVINALFLGILFGGVAALYFLLSRRATLKSYIPYAPYLAVGAIVVVLRTFHG